MLTEIPVPYYAKDILTLSAVLTKADITPYHLGSSPPAPAERFSPDIITKLSARSSWQPCSVRALGVKGPKDNLSQSKFGLCRRSALIPRYLGYLRWSERQCVRSCHLESNPYREGTPSVGCSGKAQGRPASQKWDPAAGVLLGRKVVWPVTVKIGWNFWTRATYSGLN